MAMYSAKTEAVAQLNANPAQAVGKVNEPWHWERRLLATRNCPRGNRTCAWSGQSGLSTDEDRAPRRSQMLLRELSGTQQPLAAPRAAARNSQLTRQGVRQQTAPRGAPTPAGSVSPKRRTRARSQSEPARANDGRRPKPDRCQPGQARQKTNVASDQARVLVERTSGWSAYPRPEISPPNAPITSGRSTGSMTAVANARVDIGVSGGPQLTGSRHVAVRNIPFRVMGHDPIAGVG